ncbi:hypothetical protein CKO28_03445 [Rhodovibrio sodomensis]|uniref:Uncharacterized protein n=1 Tax=Rhodovibrio sodomensis TaxID=1088 RepID=A0ABS1DCI1_9PROT|nr:hypothetical protein [Rhodovibrio sodomensis]
MTGKMTGSLSDPGVVRLAGSRPTDGTPWYYVTGKKAALIARWDARPHVFGAHGLEDPSGSGNALLIRENGRRLRCQFQFGQDRRVGVGACQNDRTAIYDMWIGPRGGELAARFAGEQPADDA